jgi:hypothetical protein
MPKPETLSALKDAVVRAADATGPELAPASRIAKRRVPLRTGRNVGEEFSSRRASCAQAAPFAESTTASKEGNAR